MFKDFTIKLAGTQKISTAIFAQTAFPSNEFVKDAILQVVLKDMSDVLSREQNQTFLETKMRVEKIMSCIFWTNAGQHGVKAAASGVVAWKSWKQAKAATLTSGGILVAEGFVLSQAAATALKVATAEVVVAGANVMFAMNADSHYKKGLKEIPDDWIEVEAPEKLKITSESFKEFLRQQGYNPKNWRKVVEKWAAPDGIIYQRNYWTNGTEYFYHGEGIEVFFPH